MNDDLELDSVDIAGVAGITYRQLDYWTTSGHLVAHAGRGSGHPRRWTEHERDVAIVMARLVAAGIPLTAAAVYARDVVDRDQTTFVLAAGITLTISPEGAS